MYCDFYAFREKPFTLTPNPEFIFLSRNHKEAFAHLLYGIDNHAGFIELTGEVGTGKTTVVRTLLGQLENEKYRTALIFNPCVSALGLLQGISREFGLPSDSTERAELLEGINRFLLDENAAGRTVVLVVDEAQNLEPPVLEQIRLLSNLETERDKLIQIILVGQPELRDLLNRSDLRQLAQRITVRFHLHAMDAEDTAAYIRHRVTRAAGRETVSFTSAAVARIFRFSGGVPRLINAVCDRMLLAGYSLGLTTIDGKIARRAVAEVRREEGGGRSRRFPAAAAFALAGCLAVGIAAGILWDGKPRSPSAEPAPQASANADRLQFFDLVRLLDKQTPAGSAALSFNAILPLWGAEPLSGESMAGTGVSFGELAARRGLEVYHLTGKIDDLLRLDLPAIIEISTSSSEKRFIAVTGTRHGFLQIETGSGQQSFGEGEISHYWTGKAWVLWRNPLNIPVPFTATAGSEKAAALQELLRKAHLYGGPATGKVDPPTQAAIRTFQESCGISPDGTLGAKSLLLLYRRARIGQMPVLGKEKGET